MITTKQLRKDLSKGVKEITKNGITQRELALKTGLTEATINNAINRPDMVKLETLELIIKKGS